MQGWQPRRLTPTQLEERRLVAARWLRAGRLSQAEIARRLGVSEAAVSGWKRKLAAAGLAGLRRRAHTGRRPRLTERQWHRVLTRLSRGAVAAGFDTERWTLRRVAAVVRRECGVRYHPRSLGRVLRRHGWTRHHPATQARERDEALIAAWLARDWPRVKRGLAASGPRLPSWTRRVDDFRLQPEVDERLNETIEFVEECGFEEKSRVWNKADLFTLLIETDRCLSSTMPDLQPGDTVETLNGFLASVDGSAPDSERLAGIYYKAALQASNDRANRMRRGIIVEGLLMRTRHEKILERLRGERLM